MLMLQGNLMVDSTDFRTEGNENASSILDCRGRLLKKAVSKAAADESTGGVASGLR